MFYMLLVMLAVSDSDGCIVVPLCLLHCDIASLLIQSVLPVGLLLYDLCCCCVRTIYKRSTYMAVETYYTDGIQLHKSLAGKVYNSWKCLRRDPTL